MCKKVYCPVNTLKLLSQPQAIPRESTSAMSVIYRTEWFSDIKDIPRETWNSIAEESNIYFDLDYLQAFDAANQDQVESRYLLIYKGMEPVAQACVQVVDLEIPEMAPEEGEGGLITFVGSKLIELGRKRPLRLMVCGNVFVTGETSYRVRTGENEQAIIEHMSEAFAALRKEMSEDKKIDALLFKDYAEKTPVKSQILTDYGFHAFQVEPNMVLEVDPEWKTFQDYLDCMVAKFRTKAKAAYKRSKPLEERDLTVDEVRQYLPQMEELYLSVAQNADFNLSFLDLRAYYNLKLYKGDDFTIRTYWLDGKMVSFMTALVNGDTLDAHFVGFEYELNRDLQLYSRILYDYVQIGIAAGVKKINFGRTSNEIKSTLGAEPVELTCYARHQNSLSNKLVKPIFRLIGPKPWERRRPFKQEYYESKEVH